MKKPFNAIFGLLLTAMLAACNSLPSGGSVQLSGIASNVNASGFSVAGSRVSTRTASDVANGSVVTVRGTRKPDGSVEASEVKNDIEIKGAIGSLDVVNSSLVVLGQSIKVNVDTVFEGSDASLSSLASLKVGDFVEVSGLRQADGTLLASRIELKKGEKPAGMEVKGVVTDLDSSAKTFKLGMQVVDYSSLTTIVLTNGQRVEVKGNLNASKVLVASSIRTEGQEKPSPNSECGLEGIVASLDETAKTLTVRGVVVDYSSAVVTGTLANGVKVKVQGTTQADGSVKASKLEVRPSTPGFADADAKTKGAISALDPSAKTITLGGVVYSTDANTKFEKNEQKVGFADLAAGDVIEIRYIASSKLIRKLEIE